MSTFQNIPTFVLNYKWSSDIESSAYSELEETYDHVERFNHSKQE